MITRRLASPRSDDTAVILSGIHVSGPPTSWNWLITHSLTSAFSASRFNIRQKNSDSSRGGWFVKFVSEITASLWLSDFFLQVSHCFFSYRRVGMFLDLLIGRKGNDVRAGSWVPVVPKCSLRVAFATRSALMSDFFIESSSSRN